MAKANGLNLNWNSTIGDAQIIDRIAKRAKELGIYSDVLDAQMDVTVVHLNGCPLELTELETSTNFEFAHDVSGIRRHLDRHTGKLSDFFVPRCAQSNTPESMR